MRAYGFWALEPLRRYADFRGRSHRQEFWSFTIATAIVSAGLDLVDERLGLADDRAAWALGSSGMLGAAFSLATLLPSIAVAVRRLHDIGRSGWWLTIPLAGVVGSVIAIDASDDLQGTDIGALALLAALLVSLLILLVLFCLEGSHGPNRFGPDPNRAAYDGVFD